MVTSTFNAAGRAEPYTDGFSPPSDTLQAIYSRLQDDESRDTFIRRLAYSFPWGNTWDNYYDMMVSAIKWDAKRLTAERQNIESSLSVSEFVRYKLGGKVVVWGAGNYGHRAIQILERFDIETVAVVDSDPQKWGGLYYERPIISPNEFFETYSGFFVVIGVWAAFKSCYNQLISSGFPAHRIVTLLSSEKQYFGVSVFPLVQDEVYVDVGVYYGSALASFAKYSNGAYKKMFAVEADPNNIPRISTHVKDNNLSNVHIINKGAYSKNGTVRFDKNDIGAISKITDSGASEIEVVRLDDILATETPTLIKMDIEGAELEALKGSAETIRRCKPRLAISIYHKPEDIVDILSYINYLAPEYKFWIRQHAFWGPEMVLYAIP